MPGTLPFHSYPARLAIAVCLVFAVASFATLSLGSDLADHGVITSDARALVAAEQLAKSAGAALGGLQVEDARHEIGLAPSWYVRHPSGGVGLLAAVLRAGGTVAMVRAAAIIGTSLALLAFFLLVERATGDAHLALAAQLLLAAFPPVFLISDSLQFHAQALFAKAVACAFLGVACTMTGRGRAVALVGAAASAFSAIAWLGLETLPAIGLMSVVAPLILGSGAVRGRVRDAVVFGSIIAVSMAGAALWRLSTTAATCGGTVGDALESVFESLRKRSGDGGGESGAEPYAVTVLARLATFAPAHVVVVLLGGLASVVLRRRGGAGRGPRLLMAFASCELPYFAAMREHVWSHAHTVVHAGFTVALASAFATQQIARLLGRRLVPVAWVVVPVAAVAACAAIGTLTTSGDLTTPVMRGPTAALSERFDDVADHLPSDAVVVLASDAPPDWALAMFCARRHLTFVGAATGQAPPPRMLLGAIGRLTDRPCYALTPTDESQPLFWELLFRHAFVAGNARYSLFAVANVRVADSRSGARTLDPGDLRLARLVSPMLSLRYPLFRRSGTEMNLHAPPPAAGATVVEIPMPESRHSIARVRGRFRYPANRNFAQPSLDITIEGVDAEGRPVFSSEAMRMSPGDPECEVTADSRGHHDATHLRLRLATAPGSQNNYAAKVTCSSLAVE